MFKSSLFCCLSLAFTILFQVKAELLCPPPPTATTLITINAASTPVTQTACVVYYEVSVPANLNKFLIFEVRFKNVPNDPMYIPYLVADKDKAQLTVNIDSARLKPNAGWSDSNGLINRKNYHHITFSLKELNSGSPVPLYFAIYKAYVDSAHPYTGNFEYDVQVITSVDYICPQSCVGPSHGTCDTNAKRCNCQKGFFDEDCSVAANEAALNVAAQKTVGPNSWGYFFFNIGDFSSDLKISLQKNLAIVDFSFLINEKDDYTLPNAAMSTGKYELTAQQSQGYLLVQEDNITPRKNDVLLIGVYNNEDTASVTTQVLLEVYDDSSVLRTVSIYLMIGISLVFLLIWLGLSAFQYKKHTQMESLIRVYQVEREEEKTLTKKDINKYFPKEKFKDLKTSFCQTMCSVCLEDFEPETNCRQLYCEHIFHGNCIEAWLNQHYNCPNCKKDITKVAIEEHLKEKANKEEKMILVQENAEGRRGAHGHTHTHSHASAHPHSSEGGPNAINAQRVHVQKQHPEESKDDHGINLENPDHHAHRRRDLPASHLESGAHETNLQVAVTHEEMKSRHLVRGGGQSANQSHVQEPSSRSEINSRAQNLRKANRRAQGTVVPANPETEVNAFRLDL